MSQQTRNSSVSAPEYSPQVLRRKVYTYIVLLQVIVIENQPKKKTKKKTEELTPILKALVKKIKNKILAFVFFFLVKFI